MGLLLLFQVRVNQDPPKNVITLTTKFANSNEPSTVFALQVCIFLFQDRQIHFFSQNAIHLFGKNLLNIFRCEIFLFTLIHFAAVVDLSKIRTWIVRITGVYQAISLLVNFELN